MPLFQIACQLHRPLGGMKRTVALRGSTQKLYRLTFDRYKAGYYSSRLKSLSEVLFNPIAPPFPDAFLDNSV